MNYCIPVIIVLVVISLYLFTYLDKKRQIRKQERQEKIELLRQEYLSALYKSKEIKKVKKIEND